MASVLTALAGMRLQTRLTLFGAALVLAGVGATATAGWWLIDREAERAARDRLAVAAAFAVAEYENLVENARITGEVLAARLPAPALAGLSAEDVASLEAIVRNARRTGSGDTIAVIGPDGNVLVELVRDHGPSRGGPWPGDEAVAAALTGRPAQGVEVFPGGGLRALAVLPVHVGDAVVGAVAVTSFIDDEVADRLRRVTRTEVQFFAGDRVVASSVSGQQAGDAGQARLSQARARLAAGGAAEAEVRGPLQRILVRYAPLRDPNGTIIGAVAVSAEIDLLAGRRRETLALFGGIVVVVLTLALATEAYAAVALSRPLARLTVAIGELGAGTFDPPMLAGTKGPPGARRDEVDELAGAVEELRRRLAAAAASQAQLARLKDEYLFSVAHEQRSPLAALAGGVELLADAGDDLVPQERARFVGIVQRHTATLCALVENLLDLGSLRAGRFRVEPRPTPVDAALDAALVEVAPLLRARGQRVAVRLEPPAPTAMADPRRLRQVLVNLLSNAAKYGPERDVVEVAVGARNGAVRLEVVDHGPGIPAEERARLFDAYFRRESTSRAAPGAGLGLAIVKAIVDAHGGAVGVESEPGQGTRFWVCLPAAERSPAPSRPASIPPERAPRAPG